MIALALASALAAAAEVPAPLKPFLEAKDKDGTPILSPQDRAKLDQMPEHTRQLVATAIDNVILGSPRHLKILLSLDLPNPAMEMVLQDNCILCHSDPGNQKPKNLFSPDPAKQGSNPLLNLREFTSDVHFRRGLSCSGCHGGTPHDEAMVKEIAERWPKEEERHKDRSWIPNFCARCHADPGFMRGFNPTLPTDQLAKYRGSTHGILLLQQKDSRAAQCASCHGVHDIRGPKNRTSRVFAQRIPETCGTCHANAQYMAGLKIESGEPIPTSQLAEFKTSVHGKALLEKGDLNAPSCAGCHGSHSGLPKTAASVAQVCRTCHANNGQLFDGSPHKAAFEQHKWSECTQCHGKHAIAKPTDALVGNQPGTLCADCHTKFAKDNPTCAATSAHFRAELDKLATGRAQAAPQVDLLAERGLDVEPLTRALTELDEGLVQTRSSIHAFNLVTFDKAAKPGAEALDNAHKSIAAAQGDYRFRKRGLLAAIGFMSLLALGIGLKVRDIERRRRS
ncbi:MAG TPA: cytochrome c3 family protein [Myxococcales bacterium]|nr:cytochrome c3 family protein [Myxococcales bacterium]